MTQALQPKRRVAHKSKLLGFFLVAQFGKSTGFTIEEGIDCGTTPQGITDREGRRHRIAQNWNKLSQSCLSAGHSGFQQ